MTEAAKGAVQTLQARIGRGCWGECCAAELADCWGAMAAGCGATGRCSLMIDSHRTRLPAMLVRNECNFSSPTAWPSLPAHKQPRLPWPTCRHGQAQRSEPPSFS